MTNGTTAGAAGAPTSSAPPWSGPGLIALFLVEAAANLNLALLASYHDEDIAVGAHDASLADAGTGSVG